MIIEADGGGATGAPEIEQVGSVSFQVAPGDPDAIDSAAVWHEQVSAQMGAHAGAITSASTQALSRWQGDAATAYSDLSSQMTAAFKANEVRAGDTAATMHSIARELDTYQQEGRSALRQAQHWVEQAIADRAKATTLKSELSQAQADLRSMTTPTGMDMHTGIDPAINDNSSQTTAQEAKVAQLQRQLTAATKVLQEDNLHIQQCDKRGQQAWQDAESAVSRFMTIPIEPIAAPPMPGTPTFVTPPHESFLDRAWHVMEDGGKDIVDGLVDGTKYVLNHPVLIDGVMIAAIVVFPEDGLLLVAVNGGADEGADGYQYATGEIDGEKFLEDTGTNVAITAGGAGAAKFGDTVVKMAGDAGEIPKGISPTNINRIVSIPTTGLSGVAAAGLVKKEGYNPDPPKDHDNG